MDWWTVVNRCRALENIAYVVAANQGGEPARTTRRSPGRAAAWSSTSTAASWPRPRPAPARRSWSRPSTSPRCATSGETRVGPSHARAPAHRGVPGLRRQRLPARAERRPACRYEANVARVADAKARCARAVSCASGPDGRRPSTLPPPPPAADVQRAGPPEPLRRAAAGAWHVFSGLWFLLRNPGLWPLARAAGAAGGGRHPAAASCSAPSRIRWFEKSVLPAQGAMSPVASLLLTLAFWAGAHGRRRAGRPGASRSCSPSPALDALSRRVEERQNGGAPAVGAGLRWELPGGR